MWFLEPLSLFSLCIPNPCVSGSNPLLARLPSFSHFGILDHEDSRLFFGLSALLFPCLMDFPNGWAKKAVPASLWEMSLSLLLISLGISLSCGKLSCLLSLSSPDFLVGGPEIISSPALQHLQFRTCMVHYVPLLFWLVCYFPGKLRLQSLPFY